MINELDKPVVMSMEEIKDNYKTTIFVGGKKSRFNDSNFQDAVKLAIKNPNKYIKFFEFSHEELLVVKKEDNAMKSFCRNYFLRNQMDTFKVQTIRQGNKITGFIVNIKVDEDE